jgi:homoserine dehydrogenase
MLGAGIVGGSLIHRLVEEHAAIELKTGLDLQLRRVAVRDPAKSRTAQLDDGLLTTDPTEVIDDPAGGLVVEVMGGLEPAG